MHGVRSGWISGERGAPLLVCMIGISAFIIQSPKGMWISWSILAKTYVLLMGNLMVYKKGTRFWVVYEFISFRSTYVHVSLNALLPTNCCAPKFQNVEHHMPCAMPTNTPGGSPLFYFCEAATVLVDRCAKQRPSWLIDACRVD